MIQKETFSSAVKNDDLEALDSFEPVMFSVICRMASGLKTLSGRWSNVTCQYVGERQVSRI